MLIKFLSIVQDASEVEGLQIVSQDWFFQSVQQEMLIDTKKFLLRNPFQKKGKGKSKSSAKASKKQDLDHAEADEDTPDETREESEDIIHATTHAKILGREAELHALVDEDCPWKSKATFIILFLL